MLQRCSHSVGPTLSLFSLVTTFTNLSTFISAAIILPFGFFISIQDSCPYNHHHHHWAAVVSRGWTKASCRLPVLCCPLPDRVAPVFVQVVSPPLGWSPLSSFLVIWSPIGTREVHRSSLRRLICPAQDHFICLTSLIISMTFVHSMTDVIMSLYVMLSILLSILFCAAASLFCACLVSVQVSAPIR